ncbi:hypothetical protein KUT41_26715 [Pseudomonas aeruginosa]|nr:hypothetical protein [Pseudomonas aeruginosa]WPZ98982.1 hypothetical protein [Pseudomonas phage PfAC05]AXL68690.1 hypothetical protein Y31_0724 [Pseudomonas aeruginosa]EIU1670641.1 hypothetical protein [Pseudomonas aeruginosa]EIU7207198.1 hypothetical protein [Pseudomonas aeruginosa]EJQ7926396.1 hypothetical protein [Pseudomonas aeruginosa]
MTLFKFYSNLRKEILREISGVENSNGYLSWDNTTPNYIIKSRLKSILDRYIDAAREFGVYVITRYSDCSKPTHDGYPTENRYGLNIQYQDDQYVWNSYQLFQGKRVSTCPCHPANKLKENWVIDDIIYKKSANAEDCIIISLILTDISEAIDNSADKKARSGIREHLLRAILRLNDAILPMSIDKYIIEVNHKTHINSLN